MFRLVMSVDHFHIRCFTSSLYMTPQGNVVGKCTGCLCRHCAKERNYDDVTYKLKTKLYYTHPDPSNRLRR